MTVSKDKQDLVARHVGAVATVSGLSSFEQKEYLELLGEHVKRKCEALRLYEPLPFQEKFHSSRVSQVVLQKGNRVGGTVANMVEIARAVTGQDPHNKYPKKDGRAVVLGYGEKHIGRVFHKLLFRAGAFRIIRDLETKEWRVYRPWDESDLTREAETKPAPPLIPERFIKSIAWEKKSEKVFSLVTFTTGWELHAMNSAGDPGQAQGFSVNLYGIDEDLASPGWYEEAIGRIADCGGLLRWSALPHAKNNDLMQMVELAEKEATSPNPAAAIVRATIFDNKYLPKASVEQSVKAWKAQGDEIYRKRAMGEIVIDSILMYPTFNRKLHSAIRFDEPRCEVQRILAERMGQPPDDWARYMFVDPGHTICAAIFVAVPPPELGSQRVVYDEIYIPQANAAMFGEAIDQRLRDKVFQKYVIDAHGGALTEIGSGITPLEKYQDELVARNFKCEAHGAAFSAGCDKIKSREESLRNWLAIERDGFPKLLIVAGTCPNLCWEMERFRKKTVKVGGKDIPTDDGNRRANTHAVECLEMAAADGCEYIKPRSKPIEAGWVDRVLAAREKRAAARSANVGFGQAPFISLGPVGVN